MRVELAPGEARTEWCAGCLTSAILAFDILQLTPDGVSLFGTYRACQRCGVTSDAPR